MMLNAKHQRSTQVPPTTDTSQLSPIMRRHYRQMVNCARAALSQWHSTHVPCLNGVLPTGPGGFNFYNFDTFPLEVCWVLGVCMRVSQGDHLRQAERQ